MAPRVISVILGTRPEAIKLSPLIVALKRQDAWRCDVCVTAQHRVMLDQVLSTFDVVPDRDLDVMQPNQSLAALSARCLKSLDHYLGEVCPDLVVVQGDTSTAFCAALAAFYRKIPVAHVEAGLRTGDLNAPWPEEANRTLISRLASLHFCPTPNARQNLLSEQISASRVFVTGNTVIDALFSALERLRATPTDVPGLPAGWRQSWSGPIILITGHRRENFGEGFGPSAGPFQI